MIVGRARSHLDDLRTCREHHYEGDYDICVNQADDRVCAHSKSQCTERARRRWRLNVIEHAQQCESRHTALTRFRQFRNRVTEAVDARAVSRREAFSVRRYRCNYPFLRGGSDPALLRTTANASKGPLVSTVSVALAPAAIGRVCGLSGELTVSDDFDTTFSQRHPLKRAYERGSSTRFRDKRGTARSECALPKSAIA
jgi:hypothetical protein